MSNARIMYRDDEGTITALKFDSMSAAGSVFRVLNYSSTNIKCAELLGSSGGRQDYFSRDGLPLSGDDDDGDE